MKNKSKTVHVDIPKGLVNAIRSTFKDMGLMYVDDRSATSLVVFALEKFYAANTHPSKISGING